MIPVWARRQREPVRWEEWGVWGVVFGLRRTVGGNPDRLTGTAWCGPACQVVWDSWLAE